MIGIISNDISSYSVIEKIRKKYRKANIYLIQDDDKNNEEKVNNLISKGCKLIIILNSISINTADYPELVFFKLNDYYQNSGAIFDRDDLIQAIEEGNIQKVNSIIDSIDISNDKGIVLNNPKLLFIESILRNTTSVKVNNSIDYMLEDISKVVNERNISLQENGEVKVLI